MESLILKASAGTGKTYRLSLEYIKLLLEKKKYDEILVITFTRKATAEIRERIFEHLNTFFSERKEEKEELEKNIMSLGIEKIDYKYLRSIYNEIVLNRDKIKIFTIDGFINNIFKKAIAPYLNIYTYDIVDDKKNEESVDILLQRILENRSYFSKIWEFFEKNVERDIEKYYGFIKKILEIRWKFLLIKEKKDDEVKKADFIKEFKDIAFFIMKIIEAKGKDDSLEDCVKKGFTEYFLLEDKNELESKILDNYGIFLKENNIWNLRKIKKIKADPEIVEDIIEQLNTVYRSFQKKLSERVYYENIIPEEKLIIKLAGLIFNIYDEIKLSEKKFTHSDILNYSFRYFFDEDLNLVKDGFLTEDFAMIMGSDIKDLLIDEFQDTSILQWNILYPLIRTADRAVFVGDGKQSIYGWRGGEKELFAKLSSITGSEEETLGKSYRSHKELINFINDFFSSIELLDYEKVDYLKSKNEAYVYAQTFDKDSEKSAIDTMIDSIEENIENYSKTAVICRKNKEIEEISNLLEERGIPYIKESSLTILEHRAVKPYYILLKYLYYKDYFDLIKFLRSDLVLMDSKKLDILSINKEEIEKEFRLEELGDFNEILNKIKLLLKSDFKNLTNKLTDVFPQNIAFKTLNDSKNFMAFFTLMKNFGTVDEFMVFLEEQKSSEVLSQEGVEELDAIKLISIHKSKGLEFETVFYYFTPVSRKRTDTKEIKFYSEFNESFESIEKHLFMLKKYKNVLSHIGIDFDEKESVKELEEEINNLYVAITRPKKNLFFFLDYGKKLDDIEKMKVEKISTDSEKRYYIYSKAIKKAMKKESLTELRLGSEIGYFRETEKESEEYKEINIDGFKEYIYEKDIEIEKENRKVSANLKSQKKGLLVHYYLSNIFHNTDEEKKRAYSLSMIKYGNMLGEKEINESIEKTDELIKSYSEKYIDIFDEKWNVKNEFVIYDEKKGIKRIDRLMIDSNKKEILILDYKTGFTKDQAQLDEYQDMVADKVGAEYKIKTVFLNLKF